MDGELKVEIDLVESYDEATGTIIMNLNDEQRNLLIEYAVNDILRRFLKDYEEKHGTANNQTRQDGYDHNDYYYDTERNR